MAPAHDPALYFLGALVVFSMGLAAFFAALQVYFRDTSNFLPYFVRLGCTSRPSCGCPKPSPIAQGSAHAHQDQPDVFDAGWLYGLIQEGTIPDLYMWLNSAAWAFGVAAIGFLFFISREREFAVRLN